jgi:hypothetical protein
MVAEAGTAGLPLGRTGQTSAAKNYKGVVQAWQQIPVDQQAQVSPGSRVLYAEALVYLQKEEEAAEIYRGMVEKMESDSERPPDIFTLRKALADLYVGTGRFPEAQIQYIRISKVIWPQRGDLGENASAISSGDQKVLSLPSIRPCPVSRLSAGQDYKIVWGREFLAYPGSTSPQTSDDKNGGGDGRRMVQVCCGDRPVGRGEEIPGGHGQVRAAPDIINDQQVDLSMPERRTGHGGGSWAETLKMSKLQELEQRWNNGMMLIKSGRYDEASTFSAAMTPNMQEGGCQIGEVSSGQG